jgi:hypothetical protein
VENLQSSSRGSGGVIRRAICARVAETCNG